MKIISTASGVKHPDRAKKMSVSTNYPKLVRLEGFSDEYNFKKLDLYSIKSDTKPFRNSKLYA